LLPDRVLAAATIAGVAPYDAEGLDWTAGMGEDNEIEYPLAARDPEALLEWMRPRVHAMANIAPQEIVEVLRSIISDVDEDALSGEFGEVVAGSFRRAFAHGPWGWYDDRASPHLPCARRTRGRRSAGEHPARAAWPVVGIPEEVSRKTTKEHRAPLELHYVPAVGGP